MSVVVLVSLSALVGASVGFSGVGGFLVVPLMMIVADASAPQAVLTALVANLGAMVANGIFAIGRAQIDWRTFRLMVLGSVLGAAASGGLLTALSPTATRYLVALFLAGLGFSVLSGKPPPPSRSLSPPSRLRLLLLGAFAQMSAVLVGIGGPAVTVPALASHAGVRQRVVGTALLHGAIVSSLGILVTRQAGATVDAHVVWVPAIVVVASLAAAAFRPRLMRVVDLRLFVGTLALVGSVVLLWPR